MNSRSEEEEKQENGRLGPEEGIKASEEVIQTSRTEDFSRGEEKVDEEWKEEILEILEDAGEEMSEDAEHELRTLVQERQETSHVRYSLEDGYEAYLLSHILRFQPSVDTVKLVHEAFKSAIRFQDSNGWLPLHVACDSNAPQSVIKFLISEYPESASLCCSEKGSRYDGALPLHIACMHGASADVVQALLTAYPKGVFETDTNGFIPLTRYLGPIEGDRAIDVVERLVSAYPESLTFQDQRSMLSTPLHSAVLFSPSVEIVQFLVNQNPKTLKIPNANGLLPLHQALEEESPSLDLIKLLLEGNHDAIRHKDILGRVPLHFATYYGAGNAEVIEYLISEYPDGLHNKDLLGNLPLHNICLQGPQMSVVVRRMVDLYPDSIHVKNVNGETPLALAPESLGL